MRNWRTDAGLSNDMLTVSVEFGIMKTQQVKDWETEKNYVKLSKSHKCGDETLMAK